MKHRNLPFLGTLITAFAVMLFTISSVSAQTNMSGSWAMEVSTDQGTTMPELTLVQDGMNLSGQYASATLGNNNVTGTVDGNNVTISFQASLQGQSAPVVYRGTVDEQGVWTGTIDIAGGMLSGTFKGEKK